MSDQPTYDAVRKLYLLIRESNIFDNTIKDDVLDDAADRLENAMEHIDMVEDPHMHFIADELMSLFLYRIGKDRAAQLYEQLPKWFS